MEIALSILIVAIIISRYVYLSLKPKPKTIKWKAYTDPVDGKTAYAQVKTPECQITDHTTFVRDPDRDIRW